MISETFLQESLTLNEYNSSPSLISSSFNSHNPSLKPISPSSLIINSNNFQKNSILHINNLPDDILFIILEYYVNNTKDIIKFNCICLFWRNITSKSLLWNKIDFKTFYLYNNNNTTTNNNNNNNNNNNSSDYNQVLICQSNNPIEISQWYRNHIRQYLIDKEQSERRIRKLHILSKIKKYTMYFCFILGYISIVTAGILFGVDLGLSKTLTYTIGFISIYIFLVLCTIATFYKYGTIIYRLSGIRESRSPYHLLTFLGGLFVTLTLTQYKLMYHSTILWIEVILPLIFVVVILTIEYIKKIHGEIRHPACDKTFAAIIFPTLSTFPFLVSLILYCHHIDFQNNHQNNQQNNNNSNGNQLQSHTENSNNDSDSPYPQSMSLIPSFLYLILIVAYFVNKIKKSIKSLRRNVNLIFWSHVQSRYKIKSLNYISIVISILGLCSIWLILIKSFAPNSYIFDQYPLTKFNIIFYILFILHACMLIEINNKLIQRYQSYDLFLLFSMS